MVTDQRRVVPATLWRDLSIATGEYGLAASLLLASVSAIAVAAGDPDAVVLAAGAGLLVLLTGILLVRAVEYGRTNGLPLLEDATSSSVPVPAVDRAEP